MPELPDVTVYVEALARRIAGARLERVRLLRPFVLRSVAPPLDTAHGRTVTGVRRLGKRIVIALEGGLFLVLHLMIAGRLHWRSEAAKPGKTGLAAFEFSTGALLMTEAGTTRRASLRLLDEAGLREEDPGGLEVLETDPATFRTALARENHTLKRVLTDPRVLSGIGNAYADEILHRARLSPLAQTRKIDDAAMTRLFEATRSVLIEWTARLAAEASDRFPEKVTAFRPQMAVHGKFGKPCPVCNAPVQRIRYADNETNYCPRCQTDDRILADRSLSRLLKDDWPKHLDDL